jgi:pilus assembly protein CpaB
MVNVTKILAGLLIAAALVLGLFAWTLSRRPAQPTPVARVAPTAQVAFPVVVAARRLPAGQPIGTDALRIERLPVRPSGTFAETDLLAKRVPLADIEPGTPVFDVQLSSGFAEQVEPGQRAVAVRVDDASAVGERVRPGNFVDVFLTLKRESGGADAHSEITRSQARLLLSRVRVLAYGDSLPGGGNPGERGIHARTAVLAVPTADVDRLALAESAGHLLLALRNPRDDEIADPKLFAQAGAELAASGRADPTPSSLAAAGIALSALSGSDGTRAAQSAVRHAASAGERQIEVIRGGRAETLAY